MSLRGSAAARQNRSLHLQQRPQWNNTNRGTSSSSSRTPSSRRTPHNGTVSGSSDLRVVEQMHAHLQRLNSRIERRMQEYRLEAEQSSHLLNQANRLTDRLKLLKHKLRMCFEMCGAEQPPDLQLVLSHMAEPEPDDAPAEMMCPITQCIMVDPVRTADGHVYDRPAILEWFMSFEAKGKPPTSPLTNLVLTDNTLTPDPELRKAIQTFLKEHQEQQRKEKKIDAEEPSLRLLQQQALQQEVVVAPPPPAPYHPTAGSTSSHRSQQQQQYGSYGEEGRRGGAPSAVAALGAHRQPLPSSSSSSFRFLSSTASHLPTQMPLYDDDDDDDDDSPRLAATTTVASLNSSGAPIWSSSVVPLHETNSRVLNRLRVTDDVHIPDSAIGGGTLLSGGSHLLLLQGQRTGPIVLQQRTLSGTALGRQVPLERTVDRLTAAEMDLARGRSRREQLQQNGQIPSAVREQATIAGGAGLAVQNSPPPPPPPSSSSPARGGGGGYNLNVRRTVRRVN